MYRQVRPARLAVAIAVVICLIGLSGGKTGGADRYALSYSGSSAAPQWPMPMFDARNSGASPYPGPTDGNVAWIFGANWTYAAFCSPVVGSNGTLYTWAPGEAVALAPSGQLLWEFSTGGSESTCPSLGQDGTIYLGVTSALPALNGTSAKLLALRQDGTLAWEFNDEVGSMITPIKLSPSGTIYVDDVMAFQRIGSPDIAYRGTLWALSASGTVEWNLTLENRTSVTAIAAVAPDGTIYAMSADTILALNPNGTRKWSYSTGVWQGMTAPSVSDNGTVFVGTASGLLYALGPGGNLLWSFQSPWGTISSIALDSNGQLYVVSDGLLLHLSWGGTVLWTFDGGSQGFNFAPTQPIVGANGLVYLAGSGGGGTSQSSGDLYAVDNGGRVRWHFAIEYVVPAQGFGAGPSLSASGVLYIGGSGLYAFGPSVGKTPDLASQLLLPVAISATVVVLAVSLGLLIQRRRHPPDNKI